MTPAFKHRLLGTAILVMAGIIFLPDLLDGEKQVVKDDFKVIPNRPEFQGVQQQQVLEPEVFTQAEAELAAEPVDEQPLDAGDNGATETLPAQQYAQVTAPTTEKKVQPQTNPALAQSGWVVRVGSFSKEQNANALVAKLRQAGFVTFTRNITSSEGIRLTSVLVGPELRKEKLEQQLPKLQQLTGIERLSVMSYQPTENR
ncbi:MAG: dedD protein [Alteromonadaceae bacterium]|uniref:SPOR domain-containing protein n=1 Tax=Rheinheimera aquimaris TaxID=412437 RepID=A0ABN1DWK4_9GAMM|nr:MULTISPECIES: SPOR domain-containing protein [Rheinheimera]MBJ91250.1 dedD protein [Alteromonadaceae bacterium]MCB5213851.1 SPOR domain-containing protein [Rheinheimera aquimaris]MCD1597967.1 SPOR domain-containing protein [Rheinheimera aquimaris]HBN88317.1 dedD protein [Rheinheimera sp.]